MEFRFLQGKTDDLADAFLVRQKVFVEEQGFTPALEFDGIDENAVHVVGYENNEPVCTARLFEEENAREGFLHIGRVCVLPQMRGTGTGANMLQALITYAKQNGATGVELGAQTHATKFYEKLGFTSFGEVFYDEEVPHVMMELIFTHM